MKKLLLILSSLTVVSSASSIVVSCSTKTEKPDLNTIERVLSSIIHAKLDDQNPWTNEELEQELVNQKVDEIGGITVKASNEIEPGASTNKQQEILLIGNGSSKNSFKYSGTIKIIYNFGGNKPPQKKQITLEETKKTIEGLQKYLTEIYYKSSEIVRRTFIKSANIPGTPAEGLVFETISIEGLEETFNNSEGLKKTEFKIKGSVGINSNDINYYEFSDDIKPEDKEFECSGWIVDPIIIENSKVDEAKQNITKWINDENNKFNDFGNFKNLIEKNQKNIIGVEGIEISIVEDKLISENQDKDSIYWKNDVQITLKASNGYEFEKEVTINKNNIFKANTEVLKITKNALDWYALVDTNENIFIKPQFIRFNENDTNENQKKYLLDNKITSNWDENETKKQQTEFVKDLNIFTGKDADDQIENFVNKSIFNNTTAFNYFPKQLDIYENELPFNVDEILFIDKNDKDLNDKLMNILGKKQSLSTFKENATISEEITNLKTHEYYVVFLEKLDDENFQASSKTLNVQLQSWAI
ncbi:Vmc-like lipoprotein signal peptide domain-containing protein [Mesoplasma florum]|uniref:Vmc-like lipoprotein signal peptide domain-containing protein n=1 Tax=Mesoplasma florum TaxID=2151 RepID=UPI000BE4348A|nr:hypothetical protein [Mesoplasma florum]ATI73414.1 hypothetical protein CQZ69_02480 [Mesoplasma florum]AVN61816.1 hypothetical protein CG004_02505 [Mesoplasma florum]